MSALVESIRRSPGWSFLTILPKAAPRATVAWWALIAVRGGLPAAFAVAVGALTAAVQRQAGLEVALAWVGTVWGGKSPSEFRLWDCKRPSGRPDGSCQPFIANVTNCSNSCLYFSAPSSPP